MIQVRKSDERGHAFHGWLDTYHTFSFAGYYDERFMGYRSLRVINEDRVQPGKGFATHPHRDMEIITYVLEGALEHKDSMGNGSVIRPGDVQRMSAGSGVLHSEFNPSKDDPVHLLQIWILPDKLGIKPSYEQTKFDRTEMNGSLRLIASPDGRDGSVTIHQDANVYVTVLESGKSIALPDTSKRHLWIQVARGEVKLGEHVLRAGDGAAVEGESDLVMTGVEDADVVLFDML
jgi:redox-sensitive bicupin YhaK (pirin superfamily)